MRRPLFALVLLGACSGSARPMTPDNRPEPSAKVRAEMIFLGTGEGLIEATCRDPERTAMDTECADRAKALVAARAVVAGTDGRRLRLTGQVSDGCEASGEQTIITFANEDGSEAGFITVVAVSPPEADVHLQTYDASFTAETPPTVPNDVREKIAALGGVAANQLVILQNLDVDLDGDGTTSRIVSANVPQPDDAGYVWSGLVVVPAGRVEGATAVWESDLEHAMIAATLDIDGDGTLEVVIATEYYEGSGVSLGRIANGKLELITGYGCGA